jgi:hypothetical protein
MRERIYFLIFLLLISANNSIAQKPLFIEGKIIDKETKDPLPAYITVAGTDLGISADTNGYFKLYLKSIDSKENIKLLVWLVGYKKKEVNGKIGEHLTIELELEPLPSHDVVVTADSLVSDEKAKKTVTMTKMDVYTLPGTAADPVYASHILPGVNSLPDASSMLIRGGAPEEVAYFFDGIEVVHPFLSRSLHESYFSIFDNQIIEDFSVSTSGFPSKFGDALSGVMDITPKDTLFKSEGGLGLSILGLNSYAGIPIKNRGTFVGSYNRGHSALMTKINNREESEFETEHAFGKINLKLNKFHNIRFLGLFDEYKFSHESGLNTNSQNKIAGFSLTSVLARNLVTRFTLSHINYLAFYQVEDAFQKTIKDITYQARMEVSLDLESHYLELGGDFQKRKIDVSVLETHPENYLAHGTRWGIYFNDKLRILDNLYLNLGGRIYSLDLNNYQLTFDPRASLAYLITKNDILRFSFGLYHQYGDYLVLKENDNLKPKYAAHYSLSYDRISKGTEIRATLYDKEYRNLFLGKEESLVSNEGFGYARGAEFFIKKKKKKYDAIFVYNFLKSKRKEGEVQYLARSPYEIDHSLTGIFKIKFNNASLGIRFSYASGLPFTPLVGREWDRENQIYSPLWGEPLSKRYPSYQRMDINGTKSVNFRNRLIVLYFGITNVLNNKNVSRYEYSDDYSTRKNIHSIFGRSFFIGIYIPFF